MALLIGQLERAAYSESKSLTSARTESSLLDLALEIAEADPDAYEPGAVLNQAARQLAVDWVIAQGCARVLGKRRSSRRQAAKRRRLNSKRAARDLRALLEVPARA